MMRPLAALLLLTLLLTSCRDESAVPSGILKPEKMQAVMWDIMRADVFTENFISKDSSKDMKKEDIILQQQAFLINGVTKEAYYKSYDYYQKNPAQFGVMLDTLSARATRDRDKLLRPAVGK